MPSRSEPDYYAILGVSSSDSEAELRSAYLDLVKEHHPDRHRTYVQKLSATRRLQEINVAYSILRDRAARAAYDARKRSTEVSPPGQSRGAPETAGAPRRRPIRPSASSVFFHDPRWRWVRRAVFIGLLALGWTLAFLWTSQPLGPTALVTADHWTRSLPVRVVMSAIIGPMILMFGFAILFAYVLMASMVVMGIVMAFQSAWEKATHKKTTLRQELTLLLVVLGVASFTVIGPRVRPDALGVILTLVGWFGAMAAPAALIEVVAMVAYQIWSRRIVSTTDALARI